MQAMQEKKSVDYLTRKETPDMKRKKKRTKNEIIISPSSSPK